MRPRTPLTDAEREQYQWQLWVDGFGEAGQEKLKAASVLISRVGGVGGAVAQQLAAAGVGRLVLAHAGNLRLNDLHRQILMAHAGVGQPRVHLAAERLRQLNPHVIVEAVAENVTEDNMGQLMEGVDLAVGCAPLFEERLLMSRECVRRGKPYVDCAMYEMELQVTTVVPGRTPCLACLYPTIPAEWKREFPVVGAVAGTAGCLGAMEALKMLAGIGEPLLGRMLVADLGAMSFRVAQLHHAMVCAVCRED
jgi:molybdopterin/thiamine biosynthesis adenylyltransferase